jgi:hypothetical protein
MMQPEEPAVWEHNHAAEPYFPLIPGRLTVYMFIFNVHFG